jgi:hypothetical protein
VASQVCCLACLFVCFCFVTNNLIYYKSYSIVDGLVISHMPYGPTAYFGLLNVVTRHDIKGV